MPTGCEKISAKIFNNTEVYLKMLRLSWNFIRRYSHVSSSSIWNFSWLSCTVSEV